MTPQQDGSVSKPPTDYPEINIFTFSRSKEEAASSVVDLLTKFVPEDIWPWTTITALDESEGSSVIRVTISYSGT